MRPIVLFLLIVLALPAAGQTTETPVPFDSAGRIASVNPRLVSRLGLVAPAWPVAGDFVEARLYQINTGGHALTVTRPNGAVERFMLDDTRAAALRAAFADGLQRAGKVVAEDAASVISEPARGPFVRDQMLLASLIYGPALASLTHSGEVGGGMYLMSVGGTFFAVNEFARRRTISKSQNALTTDGALRGWVATALAAQIFTDSLSDDAAAVVALIGGIGGSVVGYHRGRGLTNSEAQSAMTMSTLAAGVALGTIGSTGALNNDDNGRIGSAVTLAGGIAGYIAGPRYPQRAKYTVTAGDVQLVRLGAYLGAAAAITPFVEANDLPVEAVAGVLTAGWVGGAVIADRIAAKPFNHSESDARMIHVGALGGALMGAAIPLMTRSESALFWTGALTGGAIAGAFATQHMMAPSRDGSLMRSSTSGANSSARVQLQPENALLAASGMRGNHTLLSIRF